MVVNTTTIAIIACVHSQIRLIRLWPLVVSSSCAVVVAGNGGETYLGGGPGSTIGISADDTTLVVVSTLGCSCVSAIYAPFSI